jgi:hypothetical protein
MQMIEKQDVPTQLMTSLEKIIDHYLSNLKEGESITLVPGKDIREYSHDELDNLPVHSKYLLYSVNREKEVTAYNMFTAAEALIPLNALSYEAKSKVAELMCKIPSQMKGKARTMETFLKIFHQANLKFAGKEEFALLVFNAVDPEMAKEFRHINITIDGVKRGITLIAYKPPVTLNDFDGIAGCFLIKPELLKVEMFETTYEEFGLTNITTVTLK